MTTKHIVHGVDLAGRAGHIYHVAADEKGMHCNDAINISETDLKLLPNAEGDVILFGDTNVGDAQDGKRFYIHRKAAEGNDYIRFFIGSTRRGYIHGSPAGGLYIQGQTEIGLNSITDDLVLQVGDSVGVKKIYFRDSGNNDVGTIDSDGNVWFEGDLATGGSIANSRLSIQGSESGEHSNNAGLAMQNTATGGDTWYLRVGATGTMTPAGGFSIADTTSYRLVIDQDGNVGIGTVIPGLPLEVRSADDNQGFFFDSRAQAAGVGGGIAFGAKYNDAGGEAMAGRIGTRKANSTSGHVGFNLIIETQDSVGSITERVIFTHDGLCGIGDIIPTKTLDINGDTRIRGDLTIDGNVIAPLTFESSAGQKIVLYANYVIGVESSELRIASNGSITFRTDGYSGDVDVVITDAGYLGIGTETPHDDLHISSTTPSFIFEETDALGSEKVWELTATGGMLKLRTMNDLYTGTQTVFEIDRGGTSPTTFCFPNSKVGIRTTTLSGQLTVDQPDVSGAIPVLTLDQGDVSEPFIEFLGGTVVGGLSGTNKYLAVKAEGSIYYLRLFN